MSKQGERIQHIYNDYTSNILLFKFCSIFCLLFLAWGPGEYKNGTGLYLNKERE